MFGGAEKSLQQTGTPAPRLTPCLSHAALRHPLQRGSLRPLPGKLFLRHTRFYALPGRQGARRAADRLLNRGESPPRGVCGLRRPIRRPLESEKPNRSRPPGVVCHSACASECADVIHTDRRQGTDMRACRGEERSLAPGVGLHGLRRAVSPGCPLSQAARRVRMPMKRWDLFFFLQMLLLL